MGYEKPVKKPRQKLERKLIEFDDDNISQNEMEIDAASQSEVCLPSVANDSGECASSQNCENNALIGTKKMHRSNRYRNKLPY